MNGPKEMGKCDLCGNDQHGRYHIDGPCRYLCPVCEEIVLKWEQKKADHEIVLLGFRRAPKGRRQE